MNGEYSYLSMISRTFSLLLIVVVIAEVGMAAQLILKPNLPTCTVLIASFDVRFADVADKGVGPNSCDW